MFFWSMLLGGQAGSFNVSERYKGNERRSLLICGADSGVSKKKRPNNLKDVKRRNLGRINLKRGGPGPRETKDWEDIFCRRCRGGGEGSMYGQ